MTFEMTPEEVTKRYGKLFCKGFFTLVDEKNGKALIIEECSAKGPVEWDMCNRKRAGGALEHIRVEGTTLIMDTIIGEKRGPFRTGIQGPRRARSESPYCGWGHSKDHMGRPCRS